MCDVRVLMDVAHMGHVLLNNHVKVAIEAQLSRDRWRLL